MQSQHKNPSAPEAAWEDSCSSRRLHLLRTTRDPAVEQEKTDELNLLAGKQAEYSGNDGAENGFGFQGGKAAPVDEEQNETIAVCDREHESKLARELLDSKRDSNTADRGFDPAG